MKTGILQGDTLAPFLFIIVVDYIMTNSGHKHLGFIMQPRLSSRFPKVRLNDLEFADDIALLENSIPAAQSQLSGLASSAKNVNLNISSSKTKVLAVNTGSNTPIKLEGKPLEFVSDFKYLGSFIRSSGHDFKVRKGKAWGAFWTLKNLWTSSTLPLSLKLSFLNSFVFSVLLYGCESWILIEDLLSQIDSFQASCLRIMNNISRRDHVSNSTLLESANETPLSGLVQARQLRWLGHQLRRPTSDLVQQFCLWEPSQGKRRPGGKRTTYREYIASVFSQEHPPTEAEMRRAAGERVDWRSRVAACGRP